MNYTIFQLKLLFLCILCSVASQSMLLLFAKGMKILFLSPDKNRRGHQISGFLIEKTRVNELVNNGCVLSLRPLQN